MLSSSKFIYILQLSQYCSLIFIIALYTQIHKHFFFNPLIALFWQTLNGGSENSSRHSMLFT